MNYSTRPTACLNFEGISQQEKKLEKPADVFTSLLFNACLDAWSNLGYKSENLEKSLKNLFFSECEKNSDSINPDEYKKKLKQYKEKLKQDLQIHLKKEKRNSHGLFSENTLTTVYQLHQNLRIHQLLLGSESKKIRGTLLKGSFAGQDQWLEIVIDHYHQSLGMQMTPINIPTGTEEEREQAQKDLQQASQEGRRVVLKGVIDSRLAAFLGSIMAGKSVHPDFYVVATAPSGYHLPLSVQDYFHTIQVQGYSQKDWEQIVQGLNLYKGQEQKRKELIELCLESQREGIGIDSILEALEKIRQDEKEKQLKIQEQNALASNEINKKDVQCLLDLYKKAECRDGDKILALPVDNESKELKKVLNKIQKENTSDRCRLDGKEFLTRLSGVTQGTYTQFRDQCFLDRRTGSDCLKQTLNTNNNNSSTSVNPDSILNSLNQSSVPSNSNNSNTTNAVSSDSQNDEVFGYNPNSNLIQQETGPNSNNNNQSLESKSIFWTNVRRGSNATDRTNTSSVGSDEDDTSLRAGNNANPNPPSATSWGRKVRKTGGLFFAIGVCCVIAAGLYFGVGFFTLPAIAVYCLCPVGPVGIFSGTCMYTRRPRGLFKFLTSEREVEAKEEAGGQNQKGVQQNGRIPGGWDRKSSNSSDPPPTSPA